MAQGLTWLPSQTVAIFPSHAHATPPGADWEACVRARALGLFGAQWEPSRRCATVRGGAPAALTLFGASAMMATTTDRTARMIHPLPSFERPPVVETVLGIQFDPIQDLT